MKLITFAVPCYNSQDYMTNCLDKLLAVGRQDIEIIIINDGSKDSTPQIADKYAAAYPEIVRVIHQENGGHGEGVNQGIRNATGIYYKVVDSDDWLDTDILKEVLCRIETLVKEGTLVDMFVSNYVYEHPEGPGHVMKYDNVFPKERVCTWDDISSFKISQYLMMHSVIFRTQVIRASGIVLPKHTFYVDNLFLCAPMPYVEKIYYMDKDLYRYFIGRADQSVQDANVIKRIEQQWRVTILTAQLFDYDSIRKKSKKLCRVLYHHISLLVAISAVFLYMKDTPEALEMHRQMWQALKEKDKILWRRMKYTYVSALTTAPGKLGRKSVILLYRIVKKFIRFND